MKRKYRLISYYNFDYHQPELTYCIEFKFWGIWWSWKTYSTLKEAENTFELRKVGKQLKILDET